MTTSIAIFFSTAIWNPFSWAIRHATDSQWSHCGLIFHPDPDIAYFESIGAGFTGPRPFADLLAWERKSRGHRLLIIRLDTGLTHGRDLDAIRHAAERLVGRRGYSWGQLAWMYLRERYAWHVPPSPDRWVCSEAVARLLAPICDLRDPGSTYDEVTPESLLRRLRHLNRTTQE